MKYALVTGSSKGIGYVIAERLIKNEYFVIMNGRSALVDCNFPRDKYEYVRADLSVYDNVPDFVNTILNITESLDLLIYSAAITDRNRFEDIKSDDWDKLMNTNVSVPFFLTQGLSNNIKDNGAIVFISSYNGIYPHSTSIPYGISKAAVNMLAKSLVKVFAERKIRVNVVAPGLVDTHWHKDKPAWLREKIENKIALRRFGYAEEIADAVLFLSDNGYINGEVLNIDGGYCYE